MQPFLKTSKLRYFLLCLLLLSLAACSGRGPSGIPQAPGNVNVTAQAGFILIEWDDQSNNETAFALFRETVSGQGLQSLAFEKIAEVKANTKRYEDKNVSGDNAYRYQVAAKNSNGQSAQVDMKQTEPVSSKPADDALRLRTLFGGSGGLGAISSQDKTINCQEPGGNNCSADYKKGTSVVLNAEASLGSEFEGWAGAGCSGTDPCRVNMTDANDPDGDKIIDLTANFKQTGFALVVETSGSGEGLVTSFPSGISCGNDCNEVYVQAEPAIKVGFQVSVENNSLFNGWAQDCTGLSCLITMDANKTVSASFSQVTADSYQVNEGASLTTKAPGLLSNDVDLANSGITVTTSPIETTSHGTLSLNKDGSFSYTHNGGETTSDSFIYEAKDSKGNSAQGLVTLNVTPINDLPTADDINKSTAEDTSVSISLSGSDPEGSPLSYTVVNPANNGTLSGTVPKLIYTPKANFTGSDSFTYKVNDGAADSAVATVNISISAVQDKPFATDDDYSLSEDGVLTVSVTNGVLRNDVDAEGDALTAVLSSNVSNGTLNLNANGSFSYTPTANFNGTDSFSYFANDGTNNSTTPATVTLTITAVNDPPTAQGETYNTLEDTPISRGKGQGILRNDSDVDGDAFTAVKVSDPSNGTLNLNANGSFSYTPAANFNGTDSFSYKVKDSNNSESVLVTTNINVASVNDPPQANDQNASTPEDTAKSLELTASDIETSKLSYRITQAPSQGTLDTSNLPKVIYTPSANYNGVDQFKFVANDGTIDSNEATVNLNITAVNDSPVANNDTFSVDEGGSLGAANVLSNDTDVENSPLSATVIAGPSHASAFSLASDGTISYTHDGSETSSDSFTYRANDGTVNSNLATVTLNINAGNDTPTANPQNLSTNEDTAKAITLTGSDPDGDPLSYSIVSPPSLGSLSGSGANLTYTPTANLNGADSFSFNVNDGTVDSAAATVTLAVIAVNDAPSFNPPVDPPAINEDAGLQTLSFITGISAGPSDESAQALSFNLSQTGGTLTFSTSPSIDASGTLSYETATNANGSAEMTVSLSDDGGTANGGSNTSTATTFTINVSPVNDPPSADAGMDRTITVAGPVNLDGSGSNDIDGDSLSYSWSFTSLPLGSVSTLNNANTVSPSFTPDVAGSYIIQLSVGDGTVFVNDTLTVTYAP